MIGEFSYAHRDTSSGERRSVTAEFNIPRLPSALEEIRRSAFAREIPVSDGETLNFLMTLVSALRPPRILEIGSAIGVSAAAMLLASPSSRLVTVEKNVSFADEAEENITRLGLSDRAEVIRGDAAEVLAALGGEFGFVFLDGPKAQYVKYLPAIDRLLCEGGVLLADDVLLFGYVSGEEEVPKKRRMLVEHIKEYIDAVKGGGFATSVLNIGNGVALSVKKGGLK